MEDIIGIKIKSYESVSKCISIIRKYTKASIADIKYAIENQDFVFYCSYFSTSGIRRVRKCYDELVNVGAIVEFYEDNEVINRDLICNLLESHAEIDRQVVADCEAEAE